VIVTVVIVAAYSCMVVVVLWFLHSFSPLFKGDFVVQDIQWGENRILLSEPSDGLSYIPSVQNEPTVC